MSRNTWSPTPFILTTIIDISTQFLIRSAPCLCDKPTSLLRCVPHYFHVPLGKGLEYRCSTTSYGGNYGYEQQKPLNVGYISGSSYGQQYTSQSHSLPNTVELQHHQTYQYEYQTPRYILETTSYSPSTNTIDDHSTNLLPISPLPSPSLTSLQYDWNYVQDSLNDIMNRTTSVNLSPTPTTTEEFIEITKQTSLTPSFLANSREFYDEIIQIAGTVEPRSPSEIVYSKNRLQRRNYSNNLLRHIYAAKTTAFFSTTCNSKKLGKVILEAIKGDVAQSKRSITAATEMAYRGVKFDVICTRGDFSYTVHTRRHCEVTKDNITCLVFR